MLSMLVAVPLALHHLPPPQPLPPRRRPLPQLPASTELLGRRDWLGVGCGVCCALCGGFPASALNALQAPPSPSKQFDAPRNAHRDESFAKMMASGMRQYEQAVAPTKARLFRRLLDKVPRSDAFIVELGMGTFPNAPYYANAPSKAGPRRLDILGIDPNDAMNEYAERAANAAGLAALGHSVRTAHGVGEALPLADGCADAVVCTLTLCSVVDVKRTLQEVRRVLKPNGTFLFLEHVLSETDPSLAKQQVLLTPLQVVSADGCHLDRRTLQQIRAEPFTDVDADYFDLSGFYYLNPTIAGFAIA
ncbi:hypothetical protein AB1Y20_019442 [Prymnesium parvum]|uniref:Methyltransferase type 11 domain-containing protein n=1 Tax=Prymnesium parvum TaxID=97485 RepID=A0AB34JRQ0_PRYPA